MNHRKALASVVESLSPDGVALVLFVASKAAIFEKEYGPLGAQRYQTGNPSQRKEAESIIAVIEQGMKLSGRRRPKLDAVSAALMPFYPLALEASLAYQSGPLGQALAKALFSDLE